MGAVYQIMRPLSFRTSIHTSGLWNPNLRRSALQVLAPEITEAEPAVAARLPRLGFVGTGWIGRLRMQALLQSESAEFCAVHDPSQDAVKAAVKLNPDMLVSRSVEELLEADLDGVVIATPSALHADQCVRALQHGKAVFCQKPLARNRRETSEVIGAARAANKLLSVDFSYRYLTGMRQVRTMIRNGALGDIYAADLVFHNAYGPDKSWFYNLKSAGGGCAMDLGIHLVDLLLWLFEGQRVNKVSSSLFHRGHRLRRPFHVVEDYAVADLDIGSTHARLCCSWNLNAGQDAIIEAKFFGTQGGIAINNVGGSFYDFEIHHFRGNNRRKLAGYPDDWGGRALSDWVKKLSDNSAYDPGVEQVLQVADTIDRIYHR